MARGDHIKVRRFGGLYTHHGIDMGDGTVIHFDGDPLHQIDVCVRSSTMEQFLGGGERIVVEYPESQLEAEVVCEAAKAQLGKTGYHLFKNNCEHFAHACKTGNGYSPQAKRLLRVMAHAAASSVLFATSAVVVATLARKRKYQTS